MSKLGHAAPLRCEEGAVAGACRWCGVAMQGPNVQTVWLGVQRGAGRVDRYQRYDHYGCPARLRDALQGAEERGEQAKRLYANTVQARHSAISDLIALRARFKGLQREATMLVLWAAIASALALYYGWKPIVRVLLGVL